MTWSMPSCCRKRGFEKKSGEGCVSKTGITPGGEHPPTPPSSGHGCPTLACTCVCTCVRACTCMRVHVRVHACMCACTSRVVFCLVGLPGLQTGRRDLNPRTRSPVFSQDAPCVACAASHALLRACAWSRSGDALGRAQKGVEAGNLPEPSPVSHACITRTRNPGRKKAPPETGRACVLLSAA